MSNDPNERLSKLAATFRDLEAYVQQDKVRIIHFGVGAIGAEVVRALLNNTEFEIVGAIDASAAKAGKDLVDAGGIGYTLGISVGYDSEGQVKGTYEEVVVNITGWSLVGVFSR